MAGAVVVDTMVAPAWLGSKQSLRHERWEPVLVGVTWVLPLTVVAEPRFGAEVAAWAARRRRVLQRLDDRSSLIPPFDTVVDA